MAKVKSPFKIMNQKNFNEELIFNTKSGPLQIVEYEDKFNVKVRFLNTGFETIANIDNIRNKSVKDPYATLKNGGYFGQGQYSEKNNTKIYKTWEGMLKRAHTYQDFSHLKYLNCKVDESWLNFQIFADWYVNYQSQINPKYHDLLTLDKDIYQWNKFYKIYSSSTCCLIPAKLNEYLGTIYYSNKKSDLPVGVQKNRNNFAVYISENNSKKYYGTYSDPEKAFEVYKFKKKEKIIELANFYYSESAITLDVWRILLNLEIVPWIIKEELPWQN